MFGVNLSKVNDVWKKGASQNTSNINDAKAKTSLFGVGLDAYLVSSKGG